VDSKIGASDPPQDTACGIRDILKAYLKVWATINLKWNPQSKFFIPTNVLRWLHFSLALWESMWKKCTGKQLNFFFFPSNKKCQCCPAS